MMVLDQEIFTSLEELLSSSRAAVLTKASTAFNLMDLESWFYSAYWDFLSADDLRRVRGVLGADDELVALIVNREQNQTQD